MEEELHKLLREAGLSKEKINAVYKEVVRREASQVRMYREANDGWRKACEEKDAEIARLSSAPARKDSET